MNLIIKEFNGTKINFKEENGNLYAKANDITTSSKLKDWKDRKKTKSKIERLKSDRGNTPIEYIVAIKGGSEPGTWIHQKLLMNFSYYVDENFADWMEEVIEEYITHGVVIAEHTTKDKVDEAFLYGKYKIRQSFIAAKDKKEYIDNCMDYHKVAEDRKKACQAIIRAIDSIDLSTIKDGSQILYLEECKSKTLALEKKISNRSNGAKKGVGTKKIKDLKDKLTEANEKIKELDPEINFSVELDYRWFTNNKMYHDLPDGTKKRTTKYNSWVANFPTKKLLEARSDTFDGRQPFTIKLAGDIYFETDKPNVIKSLIDQLQRSFELKDDNHIDFQGFKKDTKKITNWRKEKIVIHFYQ